MLEIRSPALKTESFSCHAHPRMNETSKGAWLGRSLKCTIYIAMHHLHNDEQPSSACSSSNRAAAARSTTAEPSTLDVVGKRHVLRPAISLSCKLAAARVQRQQLQEVMYIHIHIYIYMYVSSVCSSVRPSVGRYAYEYVYVYLYIIVYIYIYIEVCLLCLHAGRCVENQHALRWGLCKRTHTPDYIYVQKQRTACRPTRRKQARIACKSHTVFPKHCSVVYCMCERVLNKNRSAT